MMMIMMIVINIICACSKKLIAYDAVVTKIIIRITEKIFMVINVMLT